jgi:pyridoxamine 5'-phosphate oxidase
MNLIAALFGLGCVARGVRESDLQADPVEMFRRWFAFAKKARLHQPHAFSIATATPDGAPSSRMVLLKGFDERGFVFYTNYESRKGGELAVNQKAALLFFWSELHRQVRIEGTISKVSREESERYFHSRPRGSQLGAWASHQSRPLASREELMQREKGFEAKYTGQEVPLPPYWGGFRITPTRFEFWQGRTYRLHDRFIYTRAVAGWQTQRLSP